MKCWICHKEMENTIGGCYHCKDCGVGVNDLVFRPPIKNKKNTETADGAYFEADAAQDKVKELEHQLAEKDKEIEELKTENDILKHSISDWKTKDGTKEHSFDISTDEMRFDIVNHMVERIKQLREELKKYRHQVCEEIRNFIKSNTVICGGQATREDMITSSAYNECLNDLRKCLDQIEQGE